MRRSARLLTAAALTIAGLVPATSAAAAKPTHVAIVISGHGVACVPWHSGITGDEVLNDVATVKYRPTDGLITQIDGTPKNNKADETHYWSYWHNTGSGWKYSGKGASAYLPGAGTVEGWRFVNGSSTATPPPLRTYASICHDTIVTAPVTHPATPARIRLRRHRRHRTRLPRHTGPRRRRRAPVQRRTRRRRPRPDRRRRRRRGRAQPPAGRGSRPVQHPTARRRRCHRSRCTPQETRGRRPARAACCRPSSSWSSSSCSAAARRSRHAGGARRHDPAGPHVAPRRLVALGDCPRRRGEPDDEPVAAHARPGRRRHHGHAAQDGRPVGPWVQVLPRAGAGRGRDSGRAPLDLRRRDRPGRSHPLPVAADPASVVDVGRAVGWAGVAAGDARRVHRRPPARNPAVLHRRRERAGQPQARAARAAGCALRTRSGRRRRDQRGAPADRECPAGAPGATAARRRHPRLPHPARHRHPGLRGRPRALVAPGGRDGLEGLRTGPAGPPGARRTTGALLLGGLLALCLGMYGLLDATAPTHLGLPATAIGVGLCCAGLFLGGRRVQRTSYRPDPWRWAESLVVVIALVPAVVLSAGIGASADALDPGFFPLHWPPLPLVPAVAILLGALAAVLAPPPPSPHPASGARAREWRDVPHQSRENAPLASPVVSGT